MTTKGKKNSTRTDSETDPVKAKCQDSGKTLNVKDIRIDGDTQPREAVDPAVVEEYKDAMPTSEFPALDVVFDGTNYWLTDGFHRHAATLASGLETVRVTVTEGTQDDARWLACAANKAHGLRRTNADKQRAVDTALKHPLAHTLSDRDIAKHVGVSNEMVSTHRRALSDSDRSHARPTGHDDGTAGQTTTATPTTAPSATQTTSDATGNTGSKEGGKSAPRKAPTVVLQIDERDETLAKRLLSALGPPRAGRLADELGRLARGAQASSEDLPTTAGAEVEKGGVS